MNGDFSEEQYLYQQTFRKFLEEYRLGVSISAACAGAFDQTLWSKLAELGLFSMLIPEQYEGMGLSYVDIALVVEELGRALVGPPFIETLAVIDAVARFGSDAQKRRWLPPLGRGELRATIALMEPEQGYDTRSMTTGATGAAGSPSRLSGRKVLVPHAGEADLTLFAALLGSPQRPGLALIEKGRPGVGYRRHQTLDLSGRYDEVTLAGVALDAEDLMGATVDTAALDRLFDGCSVLAATEMIGIAGRMLDSSVAYATQRKQFGQPIGAFQAIKHKCADMAVAIDAARSAAYYAAWAMAEDAPERAKAASMAKAFCGDTARAACNESIQIHGGIGFTWDLGLHFYLRRVKLLEFLYGDASYHRNRVVSQELREIEAAAEAPALTTAV